MNIELKFTPIRRSQEYERAIVEFEELKSIGHFEVLKNLFRNNFTVAFHYKDRKKEPIAILYNGVSTFTSVDEIQKAIQKYAEIEFDLFEEKKEEQNKEQKFCVILDYYKKHPELDAIISIRSEVRGPMTMVDLIDNVFKSKINLVLKAKELAYCLDNFISPSFQGETVVGEGEDREIVLVRFVQYNK